MTAIIDDTYAEAFKSMYSEKMFIFSKLDTNNMGPLIILGVLWFIYLAGCISGAYMDGKQRKEWREEQRKERRASRKEIRE